MVPGAQPTPRALPREGLPSPEEPLRFRSGHRDAERPCLVLWLWPWEQPAEGQSWLWGRSQQSEEPRLSSRRGRRSQSCPSQGHGLPWPCTCWVCHRHSVAHGGTQQDPGGGTDGAHHEH